VVTETKTDDYLSGSFSLKYTRHAYMKERERKTYMELGDVRRLEHAVKDARTHTGFKRTAFFIGHNIFLIDVRTEEIITVINQYKNSNYNTYLSNVDSVVVIA